MIQELNDEARFFVEKEQRAADRKTCGTFWKRVGELHVGHEFGMALFHKWTNDKQTDWTAAQAELERSAARPDGSLGLSGHRTAKPRAWLRFGVGRVGPDRPRA